MKNIINRSFWISVLVIIVVLGSVCFAGDVVVKEGNITAVGDLDIDGAVVLNKSGTSTDDFVFGSPQLADDANTAHDSRFWFDKSKGAFRAGNVTGGQWDDANVGLYSFAAGYNNTASGKKKCCDRHFQLSCTYRCNSIGHKLRSNRKWKFWCSYREWRKYNGKFRHFNRMGSRF